MRRQRRPKALVQVAALPSCTDRICRAEAACSAASAGGESPIQCVANRWICTIPIGQLQTLRRWAVPGLAGLDPIGSRRRPAESRRERAAEYLPARLCIAQSQPLFTHTTSTKHHQPTMSSTSMIFSRQLAASCSRAAVRPAARLVSTTAVSRDAQRKPDSAGESVKRGAANVGPCVCHCELVQRGVNSELMYPFWPPQPP